MHNIDDAYRIIAKDRAGLVTRTLHQRSPATYIMGYVVHTTKRGAERLDSTLCCDDRLERMHRQSAPETVPHRLVSARRWFAQNRDKEQGKRKANGTNEWRSKMIRVKKKTWAWCHNIRYTNSPACNYNGARERERHTYHLVEHGSANVVSLANIRVTRGMAALVRQSL